MSLEKTLENSERQHEKYKNHVIPLPRGKFIVTFFPLIFICIGNEIYMKKP